jgi:hypothetical protein
MKQRRQFIKKAGGLAALMALSSPGRAHTGENKEKEGSFLHVVFFWLVDDAEETREKFLKELRKFIDNVDLMKSKHIGTPADTNREVIDSSWSYSLILSFDSKKEQDLYQEHQLHKEFIENASALWRKVQVYDSIRL